MTSHGEALRWRLMYRPSVVQPCVLGFKLTLCRFGPNSEEILLIDVDRASANWPTVKPLPFRLARETPWECREILANMREIPATWWGIPSKLRFCGKTGRKASKKSGVKPPFSEKGAWIRRCRSRIGVPKKGKRVAVGVIKAVRNSGDLPL